MVVALLFLLALFFTPILTIAPAHAYGPVLVLIGCFMMRSVTLLNFDDFTEILPAFLTIALICFSYNIGVGITAGLIVHPILKVATGRVRELTIASWLLAAVSLLFFVVYPYH